MEVLILVVVIILSILLFIKSVNSKSREKNIRSGIEYEKKVGKYYQNKGYDVDYNGIEKGLKDGGIDLICKNDEEILLIQCKNWQKWKIRHIHVKAFHSDSVKYIDENNLNKKYVKLKYAIPNNQILHNSAINIFRNSYYNCRYEII